MNALACPHGAELQRFVIMAQTGMPIACPFCQLAQWQSRFNFVWTRVRDGRPILTAIDPEAHIAVRTEEERLAFLDAAIAREQR